MKVRVLWSKVMMTVSKLPLSLSFSSFLKFGHTGLATISIIFVQCTCFPLMGNFELYVLCVCMYVAFVLAMLRTCGRMNRSS